MKRSICLPILLLVACTDPAAVTKVDPTPSLSPVQQAVAELRTCSGLLAMTAPGWGDLATKLATVPQQGSPPSMARSLRTVMAGPTMPFTWQNNGDWLMSNDNGVIRFTVALNFFRASTDAKILEYLFEPSYYMPGGPLADLFDTTTRKLDFSKLKMKVTDRFNPFTAQGATVDLGHPETELIPFTPLGPESLTFASATGSITLPDQSLIELSNLRYTVTDILDGGEVNGYHDFSASKAEGNFDFTLKRSFGTFSGTAKHDKNGLVEATLVQDGKPLGKVVLENGSPVFTDPQGNSFNP